MSGNKRIPLYRHRRSCMYFFYYYFYSYLINVYMQPYGYDRPNRNPSTPRDFSTWTAFANFLLPIAAKHDLIIRKKNLHRNFSELDYYLLSHLSSWNPSLPDISCLFALGLLPCSIHIFIYSSFIKTVGYHNLPKRSNFPIYKHSGIACYRPGLP